jgi:hypothetical protein
VICHDAGIRNNFSSSRFPLAGHDHGDFVLAMDRVAPSGRKVGARCELKDCVLAFFPSRPVTSFLWTKYQSELRIT